MASGLNHFGSSGGREKKEKKKKLPCMKTVLDAELWTCMTKPTKVQTGSHQGAGVTNVYPSLERFSGGWRREKPLVCLSLSLHNPVPWHAVRVKPQQWSPANSPVQRGTTMITGTEIRSLTFQFLGLIQESFVSKYFCESLNSELIIESTIICNFTDVSNSQNTAAAECKSEVYPNCAGFLLPSASWTNLKWQ